MKLSILIPSLACRPTYLTRLLTMLMPQCKKDVEILVAIDNADKQIGTKRNELLQRATGEYTVFIDDDDMVAPDYVEEVMRGIELGVDYIGYEQRFHHIHTGQKSKVTSGIGKFWETRNGIYIRGIQHICPIKRALAIQCKFPEKSFGEDMVWGQAMEKLAKTEYTINKELYFYEYRQFKTDEITNGHKT